MLKEKALELAELIKQTNEYKNMKSAEFRVKIDPNASDLINEVNEEQLKLIEMQHRGENITQSQIEKLQMLQNQVQLNQSLQELVKAQEAFTNIMQDINETIAEALG